MATTTSGSLAGTRATLSTTERPFEFAMALTDRVVGQYIVLVPLVYIIPSYLAYAAILAVMCVGPMRVRFRGSFYRLFTCSACLQVLHSVTYYLYIRSSFAPALEGFIAWVGDIPVLCRGIPWLCYYTFYANLLCVSAMSLNRFTVVFLKAGYIVFWRKHLFLVLAVVLVVPLPLAWQFWGLKMSVEVDPTSGIPVWDMRESVSWWRGSWVSSVVILFSASVSFVFNLYVAVKLAMQVRFRKDVTRSRVRREDVKLFFFTIFIFCCQLCEATIQLAFLIRIPWTMGLILFRTQSFLTDVSTLMPAWSLMITSQDLRRALVCRAATGATEAEKSFRGAASAVVKPVASLQPQTAPASLPSL